MNYKVLYPFATTIVLLGMLFVSFGGSLPALADDPYPAPNSTQEQYPVPNNTQEPYPAPVSTQEPPPAPIGGSGTETSPVIVEPTVSPTQSAPHEAIGTPMVVIEKPEESPAISLPDSDSVTMWSESTDVRAEGRLQKTAQAAGKPPRKNPWVFEVVDSTGIVGGYSSLELDAAGYPHVSYYDSTNDDLKYAYQDAGGWHIETVDTQGGGNTSLRLDNQGYAHILYTFGAVVKYAYQDASGWHIESVTASGKSISLALDGFGAPHIAYLYSVATGPGVVNYYLMYGYRSSARWNLQTLEMTTAKVVFYPQNGIFLGMGTSIAVDLNGWPHITYAKGYYTANNFCGPNRIFSSQGLYTAVFNGISWSISALDAGHCWCETFPASETLNQPQDMLIPESSETSDQPQDMSIPEGSVAALPAVSCTKYGDQSSLRLDGSGSATVSYLATVSHVATTNTVTEFLKYYTSLAKQTADANPSRWPSLALGPGGLPFISYYDPTNQDLRLANYDGAAWIIQVVDSLGDTGHTSSLELNAQGYPVISYHDATNGDLKIARYQPLR